MDDDHLINVFIYLFSCSSYLQFEERKTNLDVRIIFVCLFFFSQKHFSKCFFLFIHFLCKKYKTMHQQTNTSSWSFPITLSNELQICSWRDFFQNENVKKNKYINHQLNDEDIYLFWIFLFFSNIKRNSDQFSNNKRIRFWFRIHHHYFERRKKFPQIEFPEPNNCHTQNIKSNG